MGENKKDFFSVLADELNNRNNPKDLKSAIIARVEQITPLIIVSYADGKIMLQEDDELIISEWFRFRCNIDSTGVLSSTVTSELDSAQGIKEVHSYTGADCQMPTAVVHLSNAISGVRDELLALKCNLQIGDNVIIASLEQKDRFILLDKVLKKGE